MSRFLLTLGVVAGCAAPPTLVESAAVASASPEAVVSLAPLAQAPRPDLPTALRPSGPATVPMAASMDHGAPAPAASGERDHAAMGHAMPASGEMDVAAEPSALADALDAYLAAQRALSRDAFEGVSDHALAFLDAWLFAVEEAPEADPHFWHRRGAEVQAVETHALALVDAADIDAAREAFGALSAPFATLVEAHGAPQGYDLSRFSCGMRSDLPEGGVWLQRGTETQNPYFGTRMLACGTRSAAVSSRAGEVSMEMPRQASGGMASPSAPSAMDLD